MDKIRGKRRGMWKRKGIPLMIGATALVSCLGSAVPTFAEVEESAISIEKPAGWKQGETTILITVDDSDLGEGVSITKLEAKVGDGAWIDITSSHSVTINSNTTVYVKATDSEGATYEQNRSIKCYDSEKPTLAASLTEGVLTIKGTDTISGIKSITVNGTTYNDLSNGTLKVQLTQKDFTTKKIEITATDEAGNTSDTYSLQNPYYDWAVRQAIANTADAGSGAANATTTTPTNSTDNAETTSPLPQNATPSEPTTATGTVTDRTVTGIEEQLADQNETVDTISSAKTEGGKEFYTITTKSGKVFYLIIDNDQSQDNVYFLTEVDNQDLMNFTLSDTVTLPDVDTVYATVEDTEKQTEKQTETETTKPAETEAVKEPESKGTSMLGYGLIAVIAAGAVGIGWYLKVYKPKHEFDDEDEFEDDEDTSIEEDDADSEGEEPAVMEDDDEEDES